MARGPRGAFLGDNNLKCILLGSHGDATTEYMRKLRYRSWITSSLRVSAEELTLGSDSQVHRQGNTWACV